jgi:small-conductance mechanosensitive channel
MNNSDAATSVVERFGEIPLTIEEATIWLQTHGFAIGVAALWTLIALSAATALYLALIFALDRTVVLLKRRAEKRRGWRHFLATVLANTSRLFYLALAVVLAAAIVGVSSPFVSAMVGATLVVQAGLWLGSFLREAVGYYAERKAGDRSSLTNALSLIQVLINAAVWSIVALVLLSNLGVDVTALVAGLGIGGIAVGLAAQGIFADLFASLSIVLDRPFVRGDFIIFGEHMGTIERIGIKSTRVRALSGEQIVISNANLLQATIRNYQLLYERRVVFSIAVNYGTPIELVRRIPGMLREAVLTPQRTRPERAHLKEFGESALIFEVVYFVLDADYNVFMDVQQEINLTIMQAFEAHGVEFAFPTRTVLLENLGALRPALLRHGHAEPIVKATSRLRPVEGRQSTTEG